MVKLLCKGCTESVIVSNELVEDLLLDAEKKGIKMVSPKSYQERLRHCQTCPALQYGTTCKYSGGLVQYKAKILSGTCPCPAGSKWIGA
ncbi:hypothetical protein J14TS2_11280 [Bacillus sp. J14TS2]|uniref:hypothetical protein n=1 Tax=Bacillus sp. J14TS2 TaxID=2807188 RepID=UPI001B1F7724|nr:hypothetical protein [Bacillus sp. J14TS2]GIN70653.1 hypothetical protein J14TS2_11280 [Bacillus sp. J14TS2]